MAKVMAFCILVALASTPAWTADQPARVEPDVASRNLIKKVEPPLPQMAKIAGIGGTVVLDVTISAEGKVTTLRAISGHPILIQSVINAVKQWEYKPFIQRGQAITVITRVEWTFPAPSYSDAEIEAMINYSPAFQTCGDLVSQRKYADAEKKCREAVKLADQLPTSRVTERSSSRTLLAGSLLGQRRVDEAVPLYEKALEIDRARENSGQDPAFAGDNAALAHAYVILDQLDKADALYARAVTIFEAAIPAVPEEKNQIVPWFKSILLEYAKLKNARGEPAQAQELERKAAALPAQ